MKSLINTTILATVIAFSSSAYAACNNPLSGSGSGWFWASNAAMVADYSTSLGIAQEKNANGSYKWKEVAPLTRVFIGEQPTTGKVQKLFIARLALNAMLQCYMPENSPLLKKIHIAQTVAHSAAAISNLSIGVKLHDTTAVVVGLGGYAGISFSMRW